MIVLFGAFNEMTVALLITTPLIFVGIFATQYAARTALTDAGQRLAGQVHGLYRYMTDFSSFADRGAADLVLWDRYLVYAAAFGISDRVLRELAKAYPQMMDSDWLDSNASDSLLYWSYRPYAWYAGGGVSGTSGGDGFGDSGSGGFDPAAFSANAGDIGAQLNAGFADIRSTIQAAAPSSSSDSGGSFSGGGFGGSDGGSGGGSFGGR